MLKKGGREGRYRNPDRGGEWNRRHNMLPGNRKTYAAGSVRHPKVILHLLNSVQKSRFL